MLLQPLNSNTRSTNSFKVDFYNFQNLEECMKPIPFFNKDSLTNRNSNKINRTDFFCLNNLVIGVAVNTALYQSALEQLSLKI